MNKIDELMVKIVNFNDRLIKEKFGDKVDYNVDWGVDGDGDCLSVCSKIYLRKGFKYLKTYGKVGEEEEDFSIEWMED